MFGVEFHKRSIVLIVLEDYTNKILHNFPQIQVLDLIECRHHF